MSPNLIDFLKAKFYCLLVTISCISYYVAWSSFNNKWPFQFNNCLTTLSQHQTEHNSKTCHKLTLILDLSIWIFSSGSQWFTYYCNRKAFYWKTWWLLCSVLVELLTITVWTFHNFFILFQKYYCEFNTKSPQRPQQLAW